MTPSWNTSHSEKKNATATWCEWNVLTAPRLRTLPAWAVGAPLHKRGQSSQVALNRAATGAPALRDGDASLPARCASMRIIKLHRQVQRRKLMRAQNKGSGRLTLIVFVDWHFTWCDTEAVWFMSARQQSAYPRRREQLSDVDSLFAVRLQALNRIWQLFCTVRSWHCAR